MKTRFFKKEPVNQSEAEKKSRSLNKKQKFLLFLLGFFLALGLLAVAIYGYLSRPLTTQINFLFLGVGGENHTAGDLTDTIIFISPNRKTGQTLLLSLPRDIWVAPLRTKLNSVYHYQGLTGAKKVVSEILGQPINYVLVLNFEGLVDIVDVLGGVEVEVQRAFDDYQYPIAGRESDLCGGDPELKCRYEHLHFDAGFQLMNGQTALKYVRSRQAEGEEGGDFARSLRQQQLLLAIKEKIISPEVIFHPQKVVQLIKVGLTSLKTDFPWEDYGDLLRLAWRLDPQKIQTVVLNDDKLINPPTSEKLYDNQWVLVPRTGDWEEIKAYARQLINF